MPECCHDGRTGSRCTEEDATLQGERRKATFYLTPELLKALRVYAAERGERQSHVVERMLRKGLGLEDREADHAEQGDEKRGRRSDA